MPDDTRNEIEGDPGTAVQFRDVAGNVYINSPVHPGDPAPLPTRPLNVLAVDDEPHALEVIVPLLKADPRIGEAYGVGDAAGAIRHLHRAQQDKTPLDAIFLDILMPGLNGLDLARMISRFAEPPAMVFVTGVEAHAIEAFELEAADYLLKPVRPDRLTASIDRLARAAGQVETPSLIRISDAHLVALSQVEQVRIENGRMTVQVAGETLPVSPEYVTEARKFLLRRSP